MADAATSPLKFRGTIDKTADAATSPIHRRSPNFGTIIDRTADVATSPLNRRTLSPIRPIDVSSSMAQPGVISPLLRSPMLGTSTSPLRPIALAEMHQVEEVVNADYSPITSFNISRFMSPDKSQIE